MMPGARLLPQLDAVAQMTKARVWISRDCLATDMRNA